MKKRKIVGMLCFVTGLSVVLFNGCDKHIRMNTDKCAEIALEYLESKYQTGFEVLDSRERMQVYGSAGYAQVTISNKFEDTENEYLVTVYPAGSSDDLVTITINVYTDEYYNEIEELDKNKI